MLALVDVKELDPKRVRQWNLGGKGYSKFNDNLFYELSKKLVDNWRVKESEEELLNQKQNIINHIPAYRQVPALKKLIDSGKITEWDALEYIRFIEDWHDFKRMYKEMGKEALNRVVR